MCDERRRPAQAGVDLNVTDMWGDTPADLAAKKNHQEALKTILEVREGTPNSLNLEAHLWFKSVLCNFHFNSLIH